MNPYLASEWDSSANGDLLPTMVTALNDRKVAWVCSLCGTKWNATIVSRSKGTGCPNCSKVYHSSFPEQAIYWYVIKQFPDAINGYRPIWLKGYGEIDIYIPDLKIGIEYDGSRWHYRKTRDRNKGMIIAQNGVQLIRIREPNLNGIDDGSITISIHEVDKRCTYLQKAIYDVVSIINKQSSANWIPDVDIERDRLEIMAFYLKNRKKKALSATNPEIAVEWDYSRNGSLTPEQVNAGSEARVYWCCKNCGYVWKTSITVRTTGHNCPACAGIVLVEGFNDFATTHPQMIGDWNYEKNGCLIPEKVTRRSDKKVWWHCSKCGYDNLQRIADKSNGIGCPMCAGKLIVPGYNDLASNNPSLAKEWDYDKNGDLTPDHVAPQSNKKVWWLCSNCGQSWSAAIYSRNGNNRGCPACHNKLK